MYIVLLSPYIMLVVTQLVTNLESNDFTIMDLI